MQALFRIRSGLTCLLYTFIMYYYLSIMMNHCSCEIDFPSLSWKVKVVNLQHRYEKWEECFRRLNEGSFILRKFGISRHIGTYGNSSNLRHMFTNRLITSSAYLSSITPRAVGGHYMIPGALGCALSHIALWKDSWSKNETYIVFEDDVSLASNFDLLFSAILRELPKNFDLFYFADLARTPETNVGKRISERLFQLRGDAWGTYAYIVTPQAAQILYDNAYPINYQVDSYMINTRHMFQLKTFKSFSNLITTDNTLNRSSDVQMYAIKEVKSVPSYFHSITSNQGRLHTNFAENVSSSNHKYFQWDINGFYNLFPQLAMINNSDYHLFELKLKMKILLDHGGYFSDFFGLEAKLGDISKNLCGVIGYNMDEADKSIKFSVIGLNRNCEKSKHVAKLINEKLRKGFSFSILMQELMRELENVCSTFHLHKSILLFPTCILLDPHHKQCFNPSRLEAKKVLINPILNTSITIW
jgi:GR25 family glycosyltransferase involved in LPS biosynthesis